MLPIDPNLIKNVIKAMQKLLYETPSVISFRLRFCSEFNDITKVILKLPLRLGRIM